MAELKANLSDAQKGLEKAARDLGEAQDALKLARDLLKVKEEENRQLKLIILRMTEGGEKNA